MRCFSRSALFATLLLGGLCAARPALAGAPGIKDNGGFFTPAAVQKAVAVTKEIKQRHKRDLLIETFATVPASRVNAVNNMNDTAKNRFFGEWANDRMRVNDIKDVYVLICKSPARIQVGVGKELEQQTFIASNRDRLRDLLLDHFKKKEFDSGLLAAVNFVHDHFDSRVPIANQVKDYAHYFDASIVKRVDTELQDIARTFAKSVIFETLNSVPPDKAKQLEGMAQSQRDQFFGNWLSDRSRLVGVDGIHVLICKAPARVQIGVGPETQKKAFTSADQDQLRRLLIDKFRTKQFDQGLLEAVSLIRNRLGSNLPTPLPAPVINVVKDYGRSFSPTAVQKADSKIKEINQAFNKNLIVETFATAPSDKLQDVNRLSQEGRNRFFDAWERDRGRTAGLDGIHILVCKGPRHVQVGVGEETRKKAFTADNREKLVSLLLQRFGSGRYDDGLLEALDYIADTMRGNLGLQVAAPPAVQPTKSVPVTVAPPKPTEPVGQPEGNKQKSSGLREQAEQIRDRVVEFGQTEKTVTFKWWWVWAGIGGLLVLWILIGLLRALFGSKPHAKDPEAAGQRSTYAGGPAHQGGGAPASGNIQVGDGYQARTGSGGYQAGGYVGGNYQGSGGAGPSQGGGFMSSMFGSMFGAAAGNWIYGSLSGRSRQGGGVMPPVHAEQPRRGNGPSDTGYSPEVGAAAAGGISTSGGDFDEPISTSRGDFGEEQNRGSSSGGDFGDSSGGDFATEPNSSGGDFGDNESSSAGNFGDNAESVSEAGSGSELAEDAGGGGGDFGENPNSAGGDFGGGDTASAGDGGGGGGDFGAAGSGGGDDSGGGTDVGSSGRDGDF